MAEIKKLETRIALLAKTYAKWQEHLDYIPLKGEVCFCEVPAGTVIEGIDTSIARVLFKVGDGVFNEEGTIVGTTFANLKWASALPAVPQVDQAKYQLKKLEDNKWELQQFKDGAWSAVDCDKIDLTTAIQSLITKDTELSNAITAENARAEAIEEVLGAAIEAKQDIIDDEHKLAAAVVSFNKTGTTMTSTNVQSAIQEAWNAIGSGGTASVVNVIKKDVAETGYAATYEVTQGGNKVGVSINIPKDYLVKSAELKTVTEDDKPYEGAKVGDKYIDFVVNSKDGTGQESHIYLPVKELVDTYMADETTLHLDNHVFSVKAVPMNKVTGLEEALLAKASLDDLAEEASVRETADETLQANIDAEIARAKAEEAKKADLPGECPPWLNPTGQTPYPWFMASLDVESQGLGPDAEGNLKANVGAYNFNNKQYYKWEKNIPFAATTSKAGLMTAADKEALGNKLNVLPKVDDPEDPGFGWEYHIPYNFEATPDAEKLNIKLKTITLDNKVTKMDFDKALPGATVTTAGLMTAADKTNLDAIQADHLVAADKTELLGKITEREAQVFAVEDYGFNPDIRVPQEVEGNELIAAITEALETKKQYVMIKAGEYRFAVTELLDNSEGGTNITGFVATGATVDADNITRGMELCKETLIFVYSATPNKTYTSYVQDYSKEDIDETLLALTDAIATVNNKVINLEMPRKPEVIESGGKSSFYANGIAVTIEDDGTQNMAMFMDSDGTRKAITFPYNSYVYGGGSGTAAKYANYDSSFLIINSGKFIAAYGGCNHYGSVGTTTMIITGGTFTEGIVGGGAAPNVDEKSDTGKVKIVFNTGDALCLYGGGMGRATVGDIDIEINGGTIQWVTAGGSNGISGTAKLVVNAGNITCLQMVNRGSIQKVEATINGGNITSVYGGGETGDASVTGKCEKTILHINKSFNGALYKGTYNGIEDASRVSGDYEVDAISTVEATACNLEMPCLILNCNL